MSARSIAPVTTLDPAVRPDGRCVVCLKQRHPERSRQYAAEIGDLDPFCSTECCRRFHACPLPEVPNTGRTAGRAGPIMHGSENGYTRGCRCTACREAATKRRAERRKKAVP